MAQIGLEPTTVQPKKKVLKSFEGYTGDDGESIIAEIFPWFIGVNDASDCFNPRSLSSYYGSGPIDLCSPERCNKPLDARVSITSSGKVIVTQTIRYCCMEQDIKQEYAVTDIEDIQALDNIASTGCCNWGTEVVPPTTAVMEINCYQGRESVMLCSKCCVVPLVVKFYCHEDVSNFVKAVKQQMNTMARE